MAQNKTQPTNFPPAQFIAQITDDRRRAECERLLPLMREATGFDPVMWGESIVGFGQYHYKYNSGREGGFLLTGFAPRKAALTVYIMPGFSHFEQELAQLGPHKHSVSCLYIKRLEQVDIDVLLDIVKKSLVIMERIYGVTDGGSG